MIRQYLKLQLTMGKRRLADFGIDPLAGILILAVAFIVLSVFLFSRIAFAGYAYILVALLLIMPYAERNRNEFLKFTFAKQQYLLLRMAENIITVLPFLLFLGFKQQYYPALILLVLAAASVLTATGNKTGWVIPTPFYTRPFEFIIGFRRSFAGFIIAYVLVAISLFYHNINLGIFSLLLVFLICLSFYTEPENVFYVWIHNQSPNRFLGNKIMIACLHATILALPVAIALFVYFNNSALIIAGFLALGYAYLVTAILARYASFPGKLNLPQAILFGLSITMPPLLLAVIPFFYIQSVTRLKAILV